MTSRSWHAAWAWTALPCNCPGQRSHRMSLESSPLHLLDGGTCASVQCCGVHRTPNQAHPCMYHHQHVSPGSGGNPKDRSCKCCHPDDGLYILSCCSWALGSPCSLTHLGASDATVCGAAATLAGSLAEATLYKRQEVVSAGV